MREGHRKIKSANMRTERGASVKTGVNISGFDLNVLRANWNSALAGDTTCTKICEIQEVATDLYPFAPSETVVFINNFHGGERQQHVQHTVSIAETEHIIIVTDGIATNSSTLIIIIIIIVVIVIIIKTKIDIMTIAIISSQPS